jgi:MFS family permease
VSASASGRHYGWVIVATLCVTETITWGIIFYGFPVFLGAMEKDLGASRVVVTGAFSLGLGVAALAGIPVGRWLDRRGARLLMTVGSCLATALTFLWSRVETRRRSMRCGSAWASPWRPRSTSPPSPPSCSGSPPDATGPSSP